MLVFASTSSLRKGRTGMGKQFARIEPEHRAFIERQKIFLVASAPPRGRDEPPLGPPNPT